MLNRTIEFFQTKIWRIRFDELPTYRRWLMRPLRVLVLAILGFDEKRIHVRASALAFYTLLSLVPALAVAFGVAKGFGLKENLERIIRENVRGQEAFADAVIEFANSALAETRGGVVAGVGVALLFWIVVRLLSTVEASFNDIWGVRRGRPFGRRTVEYLSMILIAPILVITSGALTARLTGMALFGRFQSAIGGGVPYLIIIVIFTLMYRFMPHTKVTFKAAAFSGLLAGTLFQLSEWLYLACQANVSRYNAVYGAFAALPLFLAWLQIGWLVILLGAEISFAIDNEETYALEKDWARASLRFRRLLALRFVEKIAKRFERGGTPLSAADLSHELAVPVRLARMVLYELVSAAVLIEFTLDTSPEGRYQPARPLADLTIKNVLDALDHAGEEPNIRVRDADLDAIIKRMRNFDELVASSPDNAPVHRLREET